MFLISLLLLLPIAILLGWQYGRKNARRFHHKEFHPDYFIGLNYLINEEPDKAVEIFIKILEVSPDTFETHLALGNLFRRRGEVDRAIRIHQNILARPDLHKLQKIQALSELGQDYLRAGFLDRAERLFLELLSIEENSISTFQYLLNIYQQSKEWEKAIKMAKRIEFYGAQSMQKVTAHFYCELVEESLEKNKLERAEENLKKALKEDPACVRATLHRAKMFAAKGNFKTAINLYKRIQHQDPDFISEMMTPLAKCYQALGQEDALIKFLKKSLKQHPRLVTFLSLVEYMQKKQDVKHSIDFISTYLEQYPSLLGVRQLLKLHMDQIEEDKNNHLLLFLKVIDAILIQKPTYRCLDCGFSSKMLYWQCPQCRNWSVVKPIRELQ